MLIAFLRHAEDSRCLARLARWHHHGILTASLTRPAFDTRRRLQSVTATTTDNVPFRKQLKDEAKQRKHVARGILPSEAGNVDEKLAAWELTVGLEIHAQLNTDRKIFSGMFLDGCTSKS